VANNQLEYVFDKAVAPTPTADDFYMEDSGGNVCTGTGTPTFTNSATGSVVVVTFAKPCSSVGPNPIASISSAVRGGVIDGAATAASDGTPSPTASVVLPSASGNTARPDLVSASLSPDGDSVDYTFTTPVVIEDAQDFSVYTSDTGNLPAASGTASLISPTVVQVSYGAALSSQDEYAVLGTVISGAVVPQANLNFDYENANESAPIGGNAGAFARGFTTGADVFGVVFNASAGAVTLDLDQRITSVADDEICLYNSAGDEVANPNPVSSSIPTQAAGPEAVVLQFVGGPTGPVAEASMISIGCNTADPISDALVTPLTHDFTSDDADSVGQIVAPVGSAARLHAYKVASHKAKKGKRAHRKARSKKA
jgi:hypothetical protein